MCRGSCFGADSVAVSRANAICNDKSIPDIEPFTESVSVADTEPGRAANRDTNPRPGRITYSDSAADAISCP